MSTEKPKAPAEDASLEQVHAAEPEHPEPTAGTPGAAPVEDPSAVDSTSELEAQIAETREELGDTVEALAHKLDVKARAKEGLDERAQAVKDGAAQAKEAVAGAVGAAKERVGEATSAAQDRAAGAADEARSTAAGARDAAQDRASSAAAGVQDAAGQAGQQVQEHKVPVAAVAAVAGVLVLVVVWRRRTR